jgi:ankyrin repeat protein
MIKITINMKLAALSFIALTGCSGIDFAGMESAQRKFDEQQRKQVVAFMSLDTMFPDPSVRALAKASGKGDVKKIDQLVAQGVNVNSRGTQNATPLYWAQRNYEGFKRLLELGADPNVVFGDGGSVMHSAVGYKDERILKVALQFGGNPNLVSGSGSHDTPLFRAIPNRLSPSDMDAINILLQAGADINAKDIFGNTPVLRAASLGRFDLVYELLQRGADYTIKGKTGRDLVSQILSKRKLMDPKHELYAWMEKVVAWLHTRNVDVPNN